MSVPLPNLDDRRWVDLVEEGRALIPFYGPEWTDHNYHCPGITFLELLAWITEMDVYQVNRVPESHVRKFLALVGVRPFPPRPACAVVSMSLKPGRPTTLSLPAGFQFEARDQVSGTTGFRTLKELQVVSCSLEAIQAEDRAGFRDLTDRWKRKEPLAVFGDDPQPGAAVYFGFQEPLSSGAIVSLYVQVDGYASSEEERQRILSAERERWEDCVVPPHVLTCEDEDIMTAPDMMEQTLVHHSARTAWEILDGASQWKQVDSVSGQMTDETRSFTLNGRIQITLTRPMGATTIGRIPQALHYLRCRFLGGAYDAIPVVNDVVLNGVLVEQAVQADPVKQLGSGSPHQTVQCPQNPVVEADVRVETTENGNGHGTGWSRVADLDASRAIDRHYMIDATKGFVAFGDGQQGRVVGTNETIAVSYLHTRAEIGNVSANTITEVAQSSHNQSYGEYILIRDRLTGIQNRFPAEGGRACETVSEALARAFLDRERTSRAVTLTDYERMAKETPGVKVARAAAWANVHPAFPCLKAPGVVTVVILPYLPTARPFPSRGLLQAVTRWLRQRRVVTTRVEVVGPTYIDVRIRARIRARLGVNKRDLTMRLRTSVDAFFHPLTGGPDKTGWPFGRDVYRSEVLQIFDETSGVDHVLNLEFIDVEGQALCGNVCLGRFGLVAAGSHDIEIV